MFNRRFLKFLLIVNLLMPVRGNATVPDSIRTALSQLKDDPLREYQQQLTTQLKDTSLSYDAKESLVNGLLALANNTKKAELGIRAAYMAGLVYQYALDNGAMALYAYEQAFRLAELSNNRSQMAASLWQSMNTLAELQLYDEALRYLFKAESVLQEYNYTDFESIAQKMLEMGSLFFNTGNYDVAIQYYEKAFSFKDLEKDKRVLMHACNTLGLAYQMVGQYDKAVERFELSHKLGNELGDRFWAALAYGNTGAVYFEQGRYEDALGHLLYDIEVSQELGVWNSAANACILVARIYRKQGKLSLSKTYLDLANSLDMKHSVWKTRNGIYEQYARLYSELGDYKQALAYHQAFKALSDTMNNDRLQKEQLMLARKHRFELQNQERISREKTAELQQSVQDVWRLTGVFAFISLLLLVGFVFQFNRNRSQRQKLTENYRKTIQKKEFALLKKEIQLYVSVLQALKKQHIPLHAFLPDAAYWEDFRHKFDDIHAHFFSKTKSNYPDLTQQDILWLALVKLNFSETEIQLLFDTAIFDWTEHISRKLGAQQGVKLPQLVERL